VSVKFNYPVIMQAIVLERFSAKVLPKQTLFPPSQGPKDYGCLRLPSGLK
jgi:hypothetical protein